MKKHLFIYLFTIVSCTCFAQNKASTMTSEGVVTIYAENIIQGGNLNQDLESKSQEVTMKVFIDPDKFLPGSTDKCINDAGFPIVSAYTDLTNQLCMKISSLGVLHDMEACGVYGVEFSMPNILHSVFLAAQDCDPVQSISFH